MKKKFELTKDEKLSIVSFVLMTIFVFWFSCTVKIEQKPEPKPTNVEASAIPTEEPTMLVPIASVSTPEPTPEPITLNDTHKNAAVYIAKTVYGEARGCSKLQQAAVVWCILNRVDSSNSYYPDDIVGVVTQPSQFHGYSGSHPVTNDIYELTEDVLLRWLKEKNGETGVGRVLPKEYLYFHSNGKVNIFTDQYRGGNVWDWRLGNPYE